MDYTEFKISFKNVAPVNDAVKSILNELGYESFVDFDFGFSGYIPSSIFSKKATLNEISLFKSLIEKTEIILHPYQNWNKKWESSFNPIKISENCVIRTSFHKPEGVKYEIIINPEMSFGTGHHETTQLMASELLSQQVNDKRILDMGTGTGVLAILAERMKAKVVDAVELDENVYENAILNGRLNNCSTIKFINGSGQTIQNNEYDLLLININRNSILEEFMFYTSTMIRDSIILLSGFYNSDISTIEEKGRCCGLKFLYSKSLNEWAVLAMQKI
jgi:ribosomal protein L11 methyltransferase